VTLRAFLKLSNRISKYYNYDNESFKYSVTDIVGIFGKILYP